MKIRSLLLLAMILSLPLRAQESLPVVDFGDNLFWYSTAIPQYRAGTANVTREKIAEGEFINGHPFSLEMPLSPVTGDYNTRGNNTRFFGGMKIHTWDNPTNKYTWSEGGVNTEHEGFDDFNFMGYALESLNTPEKPGNRLKATGLWLWKKEDFLNGGDKFPVTFDENSRVGVFLSRTYPVNDAHAKRLVEQGKIQKHTKPFKDTYAEQRLEVVPRELWRGWESVHLVVRDGNQFYVAETDFEPYAQTLFEVSPTKVKWAKYDPKGPWDIEFDPKTATFETHEFKDVTAVGWMILKNTIENATLWLKWYGFGMDAVVNRPWEASVNVPMAKLEGPSGKDGLYMAKSEVTYEQWRRIVRWASRNQYCMHAPYDFDRDGNMGSMLADDKPHSPDEPATGMTWYDAVLWCNALSAYEGRTPCYYADAALTQPLHIVKNMESIEASLVPPAVYVKWEADGFRLPTASEWALAFDDAPAPVSASTVPAASTPTNAKGFHGLGGNVREFIWDAPGNSVETPGPRTVLGGDYRGPDPKPLASGEIPSRGHYAIGFRPVRNVGPAKAPELPALAATPGHWEFGKIPAWTFGWEELIAPSAKAAAPEIPMIATDGIQAGKTEVTYEQWKPVFQWAEANGYRFNHDGDMGSMAWMPGTHSPDEPVAAVGLLDAAIWCNALSEMKGFKPCYYLDEALTQPLKVANPFRTNSYQWTLKSARFCPPPPLTFPKFLFHFDPAANGFRLPFSSEWPKLAGTAKYASGEELNPTTAWFADNSGERTHPAGSASPTGAGFHDLTGNVFEWAVEPIKEPNPKTGHIFSVRAHGGSFRSDLKTARALTNAPTNGAWDWINSGIASPEIGFRIVRPAK